MAHELDPVVRDLISHQVRQLVGQAGLRRQDRPDLEQHLSLVVHQRLQSFDPRRGKLATFVATVVRNAAINILRDRRAALRDCRRTQTESDLDPPEPEAQAGEDRRDCRLDVAALVAKLPADLRAFAEQLKLDKPRQVVRALGLSSSSAREGLRELRKAFSKGDLEKYLPNPSSKRAGAG